MGSTMIGANKSVVTATAPRAQYNIYRTIKRTMSGYSKVTLVSLVVLEHYFPQKGGGKTSFGFYKDMSLVPNCGTVGTYFGT